MVWVTRGEIRGPVGTFDSVSAVELPYGDPAYAVIGGTPENRTVVFGIPRGQVGLPGVNAVANDTATAGYINTDGSATQIALKGRAVVPRVQSGGTYPPRVSGASNLFIGTVDPGAGMDPAFDVWTGRPTTTLDAVTAAALNPAEALYAAIQATSAPESIFIPAGLLAETDGRIAPLSHLAETSNSSVGVTTRLMADGSTLMTGAVVRLPKGWTKARARVFWTHNTASPTGSVVWLVRCSALVDGASLADGGLSISAASPVPAQITVKTLVLSDVITIDPLVGALIKFNVARLGADSGDTFTGAAHLIGVQLERTA